MKKLLFGLIILAINSSAMADQSLAQNKQLVIDFYNEVLFKGDYTAIDKYIGDIYIQHNPGVADGKEALRELIRSFGAAPGEAEPFGEIVRVIAEDDLVVLHIRNYHWPAPNGGAVVDIFRVEQGLIVEHWDVIQAIPTESANSNGMF